MNALNSKRILIAEDEPLVALDLQFTVEDAGGAVSACVASREQALESLEHGGIDAAILDFNLQDGDSIPVAEALSERKIPFIFYTGGGVGELVQQRWPEARILLKPVAAATIIRALQQLL